MVASFTDALNRPTVYLTIAVFFTQVNGESPSDYRQPIVIDDDEVSVPPPGRRVSRQETPPQQQQPIPGRDQRPFTRMHFTVFLYFLKAGLKRK